MKNTFKFLKPTENYIFNDLFLKYIYENKIKRTKINETVILKFK